MRLEVTGPDRAKFLHNLTTNDVKRLATGRGCEAFVTSLQGKTLGYVIMHAADDRIIVRTDPGGWQPMEPHWRKYGVFDDVSIDDSTPATFEFHLMGQRAAEILSQAGAELPQNEEYAHAPAEIGGSPVRIIRESPAGLAGLYGDRSPGIALDRLPCAGRVTMAQGPSTQSTTQTFEVLRIEAGTPVFGKDVTDKNLPQEIGRDDRAISFVKGCYLGQETVARIDALGHVNQLLKGLRFEPGAVYPGGRLGACRWRQASRRDHVGGLLAGPSCRGRTRPDPDDSCPAGNAAGGPLRRRVPCRPTQSCATCPSRAMIEPERSARAIDRCC